MLYRWGIHPIALVTLPRLSAACEVRCHALRPCWGSNQRQLTARPPTTTVVLDSALAPPAVRSCPRRFNKVRPVAVISPTAKREATGAISNFLQSPAGPLALETCHSVFLSILPQAGLFLIPRIYCPCYVILGSVLRALCLYLQPGRSHSSGGQLWKHYSDSRDSETPNK